MNYEEARGIINAHAERVSRAKGIVAAEGNGTVKKLKGNTWLEYDKDGCYHLRYHKTNILTFHPLHFEIRDGDFFGHSTHQRLNEFMPRGFHVSGCTYPELKLKRPLGFLRTPAGTFPYHMPTMFYYDGSPYEPSEFPNEPYQGLTDNARIVSEVPAYVDHYLSLLLNKRPCSIPEQNEANWFWDPLSEDGDLLEGEASRNAATALYAKRTYTHLATVAVGQVALRMSETSLHGIPFIELCEMLAERGAEVFKKPRTRDDSARRLEDVLYFERGIPNITISTLKRKLRQPLIEFIVGSLGFDEVEWHRRER